MVDTPDTIIEATSLKKAYLGRLVVDVEHLAVERGEILVILGPSGSGKSVLLRLLNLLEAPTEGVILFDGSQVQGLRGRERVEVSRRMAMIFQDPLLFRGSVNDNVSYGLKVRGIRAAARSGPIEEMLEVVGLGAKGGNQVSTLSGGEAQRVSVARSLILRPEVLMLDEPFANLDTPTRHTLQHELREILRERAMTAVFVTHDQEEAARMGDRILVLHEGSIAQEGSARDIFYEPRTEFVARFIGVDNIYQGKVTNSDAGHALVSVDRGAVEAITDSPVGSSVTIGIRPEDVTLVPESEAGAAASSRNVFTGTVRSLEYRGPMVLVRLECPFELDALITRRSAEELGIEAGCRLGARFKTVAVVVILPG